MKKFLAATAFAALAAIHTARAADHIGEQAYSRFINNQGIEIGQAYYTQGNAGVLIEIKLKGLPSGKRGMHFHEVGTCADHDHFHMAKGHIMPTGRPHGYFHPDGPHAGNLPNLIVGADGSVLMIHRNEDDHKTQPIGGSGARIACGVIEAVK